MERKTANKIALAADIPMFQAESVYSKISDYVGVVKIGLYMFTQYGPAAINTFMARGAKIFLDLKFHDIPNTVELASKRAAARGADFFTIHASGGLRMMQAAVEGAKKGAELEKRATPPVVLAVTVLTSLETSDLWELGCPSDTREQTLRLVELAMRAGVTGIVCSPKELPVLRKQFGNELFIVTPGIRPVDAKAGDQKRTDTPSNAIKEGSNLLVIGRPLYESNDPLEAAKNIYEEIQSVSP